MNEQLPETDVVVVGLGAAGGIAAHVLTQAGLDVIAIEAGPRLDASMMTLDEIRNDIRSWMSDPKSRGEAPTWRLAGSEATPMLMVNGIGGSSVHYDAWSLRLEPWQFQSRTRIVERYGPRAIPADSTLADWPITYAELEPYYDSVEHAIGVAGTAGNILGQVQPGGNYFEGPRSRDFPMPPLRPSGWNDLMSDAARGLGWHPFLVPSAINSQPYNGNPECTYCGFCMGNGCYRNAKGSTDMTVIRRAEASGRLKIETSARVIRIDVDAAGLVSGVTYIKAGREYVQRARAVLVATFVYENVRLLLLSKSTGYPDGLSNNHGQVGKHYMAHLSARGFGIFPGRKLNRFNGAGGQVTCLDDWNGDNFDHTGLGFVGGGMLWTPQEERPITVANQPAAPGVPRWGSAWKAWIKDYAQSSSRAGGMVANLSSTSNFLDLDPSATDSFGVPVIRVTHRIGDNDLRAVEFITDKLRTWLVAAGASETWPLDHVQLEGRHPYGGTRMGDAPDQSVVDRYGFSHEVPNLGVLGASTFPTTGGHNPTLTLQALSWMTAQHLVDEWATRTRAAGE